VELATTLGYFSMIAFPLNAFEIEMSPEQIAKRPPNTPLPIDRPAPPAARQAQPTARAAGTTPRIAAIDRIEDLAAAEGHYYDRIVRTRGRVAGPYRILLYSPDVADRVAAVGELVLYHSAVPAQARALTALYAAGAFACDYEWAAAASAADRAGIPAAVAAAVRSGEDPAGLSGELRLVANFCRKLLTGNHRVDDATYGAVVARFGVPATVQIAITLGYWAMLAFVLNAFEVAPEGEPAELVL